MPYGAVVRQQPLHNPFQVTPEGVARMLGYGARYVYDNYRPGGVRGPFGSRLKYGTPSTTRAKRIMKRLFKKRAQKAFQKANRKGFKGADSSRSKGFFKTRRTRKYAYLNKISKRGILYRLEAGNVITPKYCGWIGHTTMPHNTVNTIVWKAILKNLCWKLNVTIESYDALTGITFPENAKFYLIYKQSVADNIRQIFYNIPYAAGTSTVSFANIADYFAGQVYGLGPEAQFLSFEYRDAADLRTETMILKDATILLDIKSTLKVQNRSKNSAENIEADDVDNVPLYGKSYDFYGAAGARYHFQIPAQGADFKQFFANTTNGLVNTSINAASDSLYSLGFGEPVPPTQFINCKKTGKVHLDPAEVKTSVLTDRYSLSLHKFFRELLNANTESYAYSRIGKFRLFAFEKMIEVNTGNESSIVAMNIAYEHDLKINIAVETKSRQQSAMLLRQIDGDASG